MSHKLTGNGTNPLQELIARGNTVQGSLILDAGNAVNVIKTQSDGKSYLVLSYLQPNEIGTPRRLPTGHDLSIAYEGTALNGVFLDSTAMVIDLGHPAALPILNGLRYEAFLTSLRRLLTTSPCLPKVETPQLRDTRLLILSMLNDPNLLHGYGKWREAATGAAMNADQAKADLLRRINEFYDETNHAKNILPDKFASLPPDTKFCSTEFQGEFSYIVDNLGSNKAEISVFATFEGSQVGYFKYSGVNTLTHEIDLGMVRITVPQGGCREGLNGTLLYKKLLSHPMITPGTWKLTSIWLEDNKQAALNAYKNLILGGTPEHLALQQAIEAAPEYKTLVGRLGARVTRFPLFLNETDEIKIEYSIVLPQQ